MRVVGLVSGGKDSCYNLLECVAAGHDIVALAHLISSTSDEIDSYMYQTVGQTGLAKLAEAMALPLFSHTIRGSSLNTSLNYTPADGDEVEDLFELLKVVKESTNIEGVSVGAVLSDYQRIRVENVCDRLSLTPLAYLWQRDQEELLQSMIDVGIEAILIKVASMGLEPRKHLGKNLRAVKGDLKTLKDLYGSSVLGEGGEYETFTIDSPLFKKKIKIDEQEFVEDQKNTISPVGYIRLLKLSLEAKPYAGDDWLEKVPTPMIFVKGILAEDDAVTTAASFREISEPPVSDPFKMLVIRSSSGFFKMFMAVADGKIGRVLHQATEYLHSQDLSFSCVASVIMYVSKMTKYSAFNAKYASFFGSDPPPRACVEVPLPANLDALIEITVADEKPKVLLVRSVSHWAPAVIGPYSQCSHVGNTFYVAGQIGLVPGSMELIPGTVGKQSQLCLRHVNRILDAMVSEVEGRVYCGLCYVVNEEDIGVAEKTWKLEGGSAPELLDVLIVSALPRSALVEWHVKTWQCDANSVSYSTDEIYFRMCLVKRRRLMDSKGILAQSFLIEDSDGEENVAVLRNVIEEHFSGNDLSGITVFYVYSKMSFRSVQCTLRSVGRGGIPVPVLGLGSVSACALVRADRC